MVAVAVVVEHQHRPGVEAEGRVAERIERIGRRHVEEELRRGRREMLRAAVIAELEEELRLRRLVERRVAAREQAEGLAAGHQVGVANPVEPRILLVEQIDRLVARIGPDAPRAREAGQSEHRIVGDARRIESRQAGDRDIAAQRPEGVAVRAPARIEGVFLAGVDIDFAVIAVRALVGEIALAIAQPLDIAILGRDQDVAVLAGIAVEPGDVLRASAAAGGRGIVHRARHLEAVELLDQLHVDDARHRVRAIDRRRAVQQHLDTVDQRRWDQADVGRHRRAFDARRRHAAIVDQHQRARRIEIAQIDRRNAGTAHRDERARHRSVDLHAVRGAHRLQDLRGVDEAEFARLRAVDHLQGRGAVEGRLAQARARDDDRFRAFRFGLGGFGGVGRFRVRFARGGRRLGGGRRGGDGRCGLRIGGLSGRQKRQPRSPGEKKCEKARADARRIGIGQSVFPRTGKE